ncbi:uncharacterized protein PG998_004336 [Apiospora kogelbergensis]|uniref:uncharacterized protein n=1 Tax=Apiospora kogelbergensis TaxID=1337665 RepID=UPI00312ED315
MGNSDLQGSVTSGSMSDSVGRLSKAASIVTDAPGSSPVGTGKASKRPSVVHVVIAWIMRVTHPHEKDNLESNHLQATQTPTDPTFILLGMKSASTGLAFHGDDNRAERPVELDAGDKNGGLVPDQHHKQAAVQNERADRRPQAVNHIDNPRLYRNNTNTPWEYQQGVIPEHRRHESDARHVRDTMHIYQNNEQQPTGEMIQNALYVESYRQAHPKFQYNVKRNAGTQEMGFINNDPTERDTGKVLHTTAGFDVSNNVQYANDAQSIGQIVGTGCHPMLFGGNYHDNQHVGQGSQQIGLVFRSRAGVQ